MHVMLLQKINTTCCINRDFTYNVFFSKQLLPAEFQLKHSSLQGALMRRSKGPEGQSENDQELKGHIRDRFGGGGNKVVVKAILA